MNTQPQASKAYLLIAMSLDFAPILKLLEGTDLSETALADCESIDISDAIQVVRNLNKYSNTPNWPAILGKHLGVSTHGSVGYASISAPSLGKALATFLQWYVIRSECYIAQIKEHQESIEITITDTTGDRGYAEFFFEALMRAFEVLINLLVGQSAEVATQIYFKTAADNRKLLMQREYNSELYFNQQSNKMRVPKACWFLPSPLYDKDSYEFNIAKCKQLLEQLHTRNQIDWVVNNLIRQHFEKATVAQDPNKMPPSLTDICKQVHQSERTLIRKLKRYNTSYKKILQAQRRQFASSLLADSRYSILTVSEILGYKESANFTRAFKKWYGQSPSAYRRNP
jgi:AraC-like DNA-binding protein